MSQQVRTSRRVTSVASSSAADHLRASLDRVDFRQEYVEVRADLPAGWNTCAAALADPMFLPGWRATLADWLTRNHGGAPARTTAGYLLTWYLAVPAGIGAMLFHHERRVPSLRPRDLALRISAQRPHPDGVAVLGREFVCLPDDPAAGLPGTTVVPDDAALAAVLRGRYAEHARRFIDVFSAGVGFGRRTLWAAATDALDAALLHAGQLGDGQAAGATDAALVLPTAIAPFTSASTIEGDDSGWTRRRESCCFHYALPDRPPACETCPRIRGRA